jgi:hypothetical protein
MADSAPKSYSIDPTLYLYTSLTAGSSHIITATSRLETILKANKIPFRAIDVATDEKARMLWGRRSKGRRLPGLVKFGTIIGVGFLLNLILPSSKRRRYDPKRYADTMGWRQDLEQIEEWNEYGELKHQIGAAPVTDPISSPNSPPPANTAAKPPTSIDVPGTVSERAAPKPFGSAPHIQIQTPLKGKTKEDRITLALRQASVEAASKAKENAQAKLARKSPSGGAATQQKSAPTTDASRIESAAVAKDTEGQESACRKSALPVPEIVVDPKRPSLADTVAAVSTPSFHIENVEALGLVDHHRSSIVSAPSQEEKDKISREFQGFISASPPKETNDVIQGQVWGRAIIRDNGEFTKEGEKRVDMGNCKAEVTQQQNSKAAEKADASIED